MNKRIFALLVILMGISILGIIAVQLIWMNNAVRVKNELFGRSVNEAMQNTANRLEELHNFRVMNNMVFADSLNWKSISNEELRDKLLRGTTSARLLSEIPPPPPPPAKIIQQIKTRKGNSRVVVSVDTGQTNRKSAYTFQFLSEDHPSAHHGITDLDSLRETLVFLRKDSLITRVDSIYSSGMVRLDSMIHSLDTIQIIRPDVSRRVRSKASNLKQIASRVVTEIAAWDVQEIDKELLSNVLGEELQNRNIPIDFEFGILRDSVLLDTCLTVTDSLDLITSPYQVELYPNDIIKKNLKLTLFFPGKDLFIYRSLNWLLAASFLFSVFVLLAFGLSIFYILRQKKISEMKSDFINNMTHEFKTPIATISVATDSIVNDRVVNDPERIRYFAGMIKKENTRMNRQVEDILTIARLDRKDFEFVWESVDIHGVISDAIQGMSIRAENRGGRIESSLHASNPTVTTDRAHCANVIYNLLDNAIKYSAEAPEIQVITGNTVKGVTVSVADKGIGMSRAVQARIFERFYRQSTGNVHNVKGFGLGLSYTKAVVEANGGTITVHSEPGKGSRFELFFPFVMPDRR